MRSDFSCVFTQHIVLIKKQIKTKKIKMFRLFSEACVGKAVWQRYGKATKEFDVTEQSESDLWGMEICPSRSGVIHPTPFPLRFLLNGSTTFKKKKEERNRDLLRSCCCCGSSVRVSRNLLTCELLSPWERQAALPPEISSCAFSQSTNWRDKNLLSVIHVCPKADRMPKPVPVSCVIKRVIVFGNGALTYKKKISNPNVSPDWMKWQLRLILLLFTFFFLFASHCVSAAQPAAVQQLQGLHEAQAQLSDCDRQGVHVGGECKLTVKRVHLKQKEVDVQVLESGSWWSMNPFLC